MYAMYVLMKSIVVNFDDNDFELLKEAKKERSWREFFLSFLRKEPDYLEMQLDRLDMEKKKVIERIDELWKLKKEKDLKK